jgi:hypothetical protein
LKEHTSFASIVPCLVLMSIVMGSFELSSAPFFSRYMLTSIDPCSVSNFRFFLSDSDSSFARGGRSALGMRRDGSIRKVSLIAL